MSQHDLPQACQTLLLDMLQSPHPLRDIVAAARQFNARRGSVIFWLDQAEAAGTVAKVGSNGQRNLYALSGQVPLGEYSHFPAWLSPPRDMPVFTAAHQVVAGKRPVLKEEKQQEDRTCPKPEPCGSQRSRRSSKPTAPATGSSST